MTEEIAGTSPSFPDILVRYNELHPEEQEPVGLDELQALVEADSLTSLEQALLHSYLTSLLDANIHEAAVTLHHEVARALLGKQARLACKNLRSDKAKQRLIDDASANQIALDSMLFDMLVSRRLDPLVFLEALSSGDLQPGELASELVKHDGDLVARQAQRKAELDDLLS